MLMDIQQRPTSWNDGIGDIHGNCHCKTSHHFLHCVKKTATTFHSIPLVWAGEKTIFGEVPWASPDAVVTGSCKFQRYLFSTMHCRGCWAGGSSVAIDHLLGFRISLQTSEIIIPLTARPPSWKRKRSFKNYQKRGAILVPKKVSDVSKAQ